LKEENKKLRELQDQNKKHIEELQKQKEVFKDLLQKEKQIIQKKLNTAHIKSKYLVRKTKRKDSKIKNLSSLLDVLKQKSFVAQTTLDTLKQNFSNTILPIVQNEFSNRGKSMHARRYTNELKKFALTLHYHSPKAYAYCRLAHYSFISIIYIYYLCMYFCIYSYCMYLLYSSPYIMYIISYYFFTLHAIGF